MSELLAYSAGIIDGEGCIGIYPTRIKRGYKVYQITVRVTQVDSKAVLLLQELFGGTIRLDRKRYFSWTVRNLSAESCLKRIVQYLRIKKEQAILAIDFGEIRRRNRKLHPKNIKYPKYISEEHDNIAQKIKDMKRIHV